jgi:hypothetical protein
MIDGLFLVLACILIIYVIAELRRDEVKIQSPFVPKPLQDLGMTSEIAAQQLKSAIDKISSDAYYAQAEFVKTDLDLAHIDPHTKLIKPPPGFVLSSQEIDFSLPDSGISLKNILQQLHGVMGNLPTTVSGEFVCDSTPCSTEDYKLVLHITGKQEPISLPTLNSTPNWNEYFHGAAKKILIKIDASVVVSRCRSMYWNHVTGLKGPGEAHKSFRISVARRVANGEFDASLLAPVGKTAAIEIAGSLRIRDSRALRIDELGADQTLHSIDIRYHRFAEQHHPAAGVRNDLLAIDSR